MTCCCGCTRPVLLSSAEIALLSAAACAPQGVAAEEAERRAVARTLVRMGYLVRDGRCHYQVTERGRGWLAGNSPGAAAIAA